MDTSGINLENSNSQGPSRDLGQAREAYETKDVVASKAAHAAKAGHSSQEKHSKVGGYLKSIVYGGLDGIITTFAVVSGAAGADLGIDIILIMGLSSVFADALSMGVGETLSTRASNEYILLEKSREEWEMENNPEGEIEEMIEIFEKKGLPRNDAELVIRTMAKNKNFFVDLMMAFELELEVPDPEDSAIFDGFVTFSSFVCFGMMPLLGYLCLYTVDFGDEEERQRTLFIISCALMSVFLFLLGTLKTKFTAQRWYRGGLEVFLFGSLTAATAYFIGWAVDEITGGQAGRL